VHALCPGLKRDILLRIQINFSAVQGAGIWLTETKKQDNKEEQTFTTVAAGFSI
jgi:hypothetical protein